MSEYLQEQYENLINEYIDYHIFQNEEVISILKNNQFKYETYTTDHFKSSGWASNTFDSDIIDREWNLKGTKNFHQENSGHFIGIVIEFDRFVYDYEGSPALHKYMINKMGLDIDPDKSQDIDPDKSQKDWEEYFRLSDEHNLLFTKCFFNRLHFIQKNLQLNPNFTPFE